MYNKVEICGVNTSRLGILTAEEKLDFLKKSKTGDKQAREALIQGNLRLVLSVIQKFNSRGENPDDLFQVGCIGLMKAIDNFDISQDVRFSTYAVPMIIGEVRRYLRDNNMVRVSRSVRDLAYKALGEKERLAVSLGREPTVDEITASVNRNLPPESLPKEGEFTKKDIVAALDAVLDPVSLYE
ncbi:MAG TPA: RNA polymerase sigma-G factor, partial [Clostridiales bacterium]|nr:RNA polymerase sigma-G factor [Clostridiales bacterium]